MPERPAETRRPGLRPGDEPIPGYRLIRRRGRGGFGEVWEAEASGGLRVALKFVHVTPRAQAAELRALNCVRGIHHPNLLANLGSWEVDGSLVVGMELADGSLWERFIAASNLGLSGIPRAELLGYMADAAAGVDYLNESRHTVDGRAGVGIQHRDIKPPNILLFGGRARVADLGMARALDGPQGAHAGIWTFPFAAPEFFRGLTTRQSDQYGLAATYCQLRSGRLPYEGNAAAVTAGHLYGQPDLEALPEAERPILERALSKEPADRWPDCRALVEALRALGPADAPELLHRPDDPVEDVPGTLGSSTGASGILPASPDDLDDAPHPSWHPFDSTGSPESLMDTAETHAPSTTPAGPAPVEAEDGPRPDGAPTAHPHSARTGRFALAILLVGLVIVAAGVRPTTDRGPGRRTPPTPANIASTGRVRQADPGLRRPGSGTPTRGTARSYPLAIGSPPSDPVEFGPAKGGEPPSP